MVALENNHYSKIEWSYLKEMGEPKLVTERCAEKALRALDTNSATGPDLISAMVLKECTKELAKPICALVVLIVKKGRWPDTWIEHRMVPIHKKCSVYLPSNCAPCFTSIQSG